MVASYTTSKLVLLKDSRYVGDPKRATKGSSGLDVYHYPYTKEPVILSNKKVTVVHTGIYVHNIPEGYELQVRMRSGLSVMGVMLANGVGTIDSDYRGEIKVPLVSLKDTYELLPGIRIAQLVLVKISMEDPIIDLRSNFLDTCGEDSSTERGTGGFGSTGTT